MRMKRYDTPFKAYSLTYTLDGAGYKNVIGSSVMYSTFDANLQPLAKNKYNLSDFGIDQGADSFIFFYDTSYPLVVGYIVEDLNTSKKYEVRNIQNWAGHYEAILSHYEGPL